MWRMYKYPKQTVWETHNTAHTLAHGVCVCTLPIPVKPPSQSRWWTDLSSTSFYFLLPQLRSLGSLWSACCVAQTTLERKWFSRLTSSCWDYRSGTITSSTFHFVFFYSFYFRKTCYIPKLQRFSSRNFINVCFTFKPMINWVYFL